MQPIAHGNMPTHRKRYSCLAVFHIMFIELERVYCVGWVQRNLEKYLYLFLYKRAVCVIWYRLYRGICVQELSNLYTENVFTTFTISMVQSVLKQIITMLESSICTSSAEKGGRAPCIHFVVIVFCNIAERYIIK